MYMYLFLAQVVATALSARVPTHPLVSRVLHHSRMPSTHSHATEHAEDGTDIIRHALVRAAHREKLLERFKRRYPELIELDDTQQWVRRRPQP